MTRVSSFGQNQALLQGILRNQTELFDAQKQVNTGKKSDEYRGIADQATTLVASKTLFARTDSYQTIAEDVGREASVYDLQLGQVLEGARGLRQQMLTAIGNNDATGFNLVVAESFGLVVDSLNTKVGNRYIFSGAAAADEPVVVDTIADLQALPAVADAFQNDQLKASARVSDSVTIEYGQLADETGNDLLQVFRDLADYSDSAAEPLDGEMDAAQVAFLTAQIQVLDQAIQGIQKQQLLNGLNQRSLEDIAGQHEDQKVFLETFIADIEDADITEAITRLNNSQTALEASYRVVSQTVRLSIVDFI